MRSEELVALALEVRRHCVTNLRSETREERDQDQDGHYHDHGDDDGDDNEWVVGGDELRSLRRRHGTALMTTTSSA